MKTPFIALLAAVLLTGSALPSAAQPNKNKPQRPAMGGPGGPGGPGGEEGLSDELREKMQAAMKAEREAIKPLQRELRDAVTRLSDLVEDNAGDKELQAGMDRVERAQKAIEDQREKGQAQMKALLPVKERARMMVRMAQGMGKMQGAMQQRMGQGRMGGQGMNQGRMGQGMGQGRMGQGMGQGMRPGRMGMGPDDDDGPEDDQP